MKVKSVTVPPSWKLKGRHKRENAVDIFRQVRNERRKRGQNRG
jgi:hypothetical protein